MTDIVRKAYRTLSADEQDRLNKFKDAGEAFINALLELPESRERSVAITNAEQSVMWAVKGLTK